MRRSRPSFCPIIVSLRSSLATSRFAESSRRKPPRAPRECRSEIATPRVLIAKFRLLVLGSRMVSMDDLQETDTSRLEDPVFYKRTHGDLTLIPRPTETSGAGLSRAAIKEAPATLEVCAGFWIRGGFCRPI